MIFTIEVSIGGTTANQEGGIMQHIISKRLVTVAAMVAMVLAIAVPTFAQVLPQGDPGTTNPAGGGNGSVPNQDVSSTDPSSTENAALPTRTDAANNDPAVPAGGSATD